MQIRTAGRIAIPLAALLLGLVAGLWSNTGAFAQDKDTSGSAETKSTGLDASDGLMASGGPDPFGYEYQDNVPPIGGCDFNFINIATTGTPIGTGDDSVFAGQPIGFTFNYYGNAFTTANVSTNGYIAFNTTGSSFTNTCPMPVSLNDLQISPFWDDLYVFAPSTLVRQTVGSAPNRIFIVQWNNVGFCCTSPPSGPGLTFQLQLHETTNLISYHYSDVQTDARTRGNSATIGIDGPGTGNFLQYLCNSAAAPGPLANGRAVFFIPPGSTACQLAGPNFNAADFLVAFTPIRPCLESGGQVHVDVQFTNTGTGPGFDVEYHADTGDLIGVGTCTASSGTCTITADEVNWTGDVGIGETITLDFNLQVPGGTRAFTTLCFDHMLQFDDGTGNIRDLGPFVQCTVADCPPTVSPERALSGQVHLPILNFQGQNDACRSWLEVQNIGDEFSKAALVVWGEPGFCPPQCAGPLKVECSGLLKPGSTWNFMSPTQVPNGSKSGILFSFTARQLSEIGVDLGFDDIVADVLCETLFFGVVGDCDDYRRFKKAYNEGLEFAGIPLDRAVGSPLAVEVLRHCPGDQTPGAEVSSKYAGIAAIDLGRYDPVFGGYAYYVPLLYAQSAEFNSVMYIQNGGLECSSVEIWFKAQDDCLRARICEIFTLAPGESYQFDANDCVGPDFVGNAWLRSSQPLGIAVDIFGRDVLMTYVGVPTELNYTFNPEGALETTGNQVAYGPLIYSEYQGWDTGVQVQNMSSVTAAKVKVYFLDRSGDVITTLVDWICPRGSQTYFLPVVADLPGNWVGSLRVESQEWFSPGDPLVAPPNITGIATMIKYTDAARSDTSEALAYNLLTEQRAYDWQLGCCGGGLDSGIGLIAIPSVLKDLDNTGVTAELAIANLVPKPGFTDFAIYIYDQNGLLDFVCQKLNEKQVEYIDFDSWGYVNSGFKGSAIISAVFWEHDMFDDQGIFVRNLLGLAAVVVERTATRLGEDIPGDEAAGTAGIPFRQFETEDSEYFFDFEGPVAPLCPGVGFRQPPGTCPESFIAQCEDCPFAIPDVTTVSSTINVGASDIPSGCSIEDVDVLLDFNHTFNSDLTLDLSSPDLADVQLFSAICGATDGMHTILDDEAQQPIGTICPPANFDRYNTETPGNLTLFEGTESNGPWRLDVADQVGADVGQMLNWELHFTIGN